MKLSEDVMNWAVRLMPPGRQGWAEAMRQEFAAVAEVDRLEFAFGCLWAAMRERIDAVQMIVAVGRWGVGLVTLVYAGLHLFGAAWVTSVLLGGPDHYHDLLIAHGHLKAAADLQASRPWLLLYLVPMGVGNLLAAVFLVWWRPNLFMAGCAVVAMTTAASMAGPLVTGHLHNGTLYGWQFVPLFMLVGAAALLAWVASRKSKKPVAT